jgi:putative transposase
VVAKRFIPKVVEEYGKHPVSTDRDTWYPPQDCRFLNLDHHIHFFVYKDEKSIIERTMQYKG